MEYQIGIWLKERIDKITGVDGELFDDDETEDTIQQFYFNNYILCSPMQK